MDVAPAFKGPVFVAQSSLPGQARDSVGNSSSVLTSPWCVPQLTAAMTMTRRALSNRAPGNGYGRVMA